MRGIAGHALAAVVVVLGILALAPGTASAHALVRRSDPPDGALLQSAPRQVLVTFTEPPDPRLSSLHVLDQSGRDVESGPSEPVSGQSLQLRVPLPASLPRGVYTVTWRAVSRADGHVTAGSFSFGVGVRPGLTSGSPGGVVAPTTPSPSPLAVAGRGAFYWGLAVLLGGAVAGLIWAGDLPRGWRILLVAAWLAGAAGLTAMIVAERSAIGVSFGSFFESGAGHAFVRRAVLMAAVGLAAALTLFRPGRPALVVLAGTTAGAMLVHAMGGHAAASGSLPWFNVGVQWVHLLAVGAWIGGLPWLVLALTGRSGEVRARTVRRFSALAGGALAVVAKSLPVSTTRAGGVGLAAAAATVAEGASSLITAVAASTSAATPSSKTTVRPSARAPASSAARGTFV
jgi:copper transport protein